MSEVDLDSCLVLLRADADGVHYDKLLRDSVMLLTAPSFASREIAWQVSAIRSVFERMIAAHHAQSDVVAALAASHFARLLNDRETTLAQACMLHDAIWGMWWCCAGSLDDMRPIQSKVCVPFKHFLERRGWTPKTTASVRGEGPLRIAYLSHHSHAQRGNAVSPIVASLARAHANIPGRHIFVYGVQWGNAAWFDEQFEGTSVVARDFIQNGSYARLDEILDRLRDDKIDAVITDGATSIASVLFAGRVARAQLRLDLGQPYWYPAELDMVLLSGKRWRDCYPYGRDHAAEIATTQDQHFIKRVPSQLEIDAARSLTPQGALIIGVFTRLIKITPAYLGLVRQALLRHPQTHFLVGGSGDPRLVQDFIAMPELAGRVTFLHRNVDLAVYAHAIDVFVDTFPMIGGLACREIVAQGTPVLSLRGNEWGLKLEQDRDPRSIADDEPALLALIDLALSDPEFYRARADAAVRTLSVISDVASSAAEVDATVLKVLQANGALSATLDI